MIDHRSFWPGFPGVLLPPDLARALNVPQTSGMLIQQIAEDSPAQTMGLRESDILIEVDGRPLMVRVTLFSLQTAFVWFHPIPCCGLGTPFAHCPAVKS